MKGGGSDTLMRRFTTYRRQIFVYCLYNYGSNRNLGYCGFDAWGV